MLRVAVVVPALLAGPLAAARIEMFENAGHALFVDEAERFNKLLAEFAAPRN